MGNNPYDPLVAHASFESRFLDSDSETVLVYSDNTTAGDPVIVVHGDMGCIDISYGTILFIPGQFRTYIVYAVDFEEGWIIGIPRSLWNSLLDHVMFWSDDHS